MNQVIFHRIVSVFMVAVLAIASVSVTAQNKTAASDKQSTSNAPSDPPMGEYAVYGGSGFRYQYRFSLIDNNRYRVYDDEWGTYSYDSKTKVLRFKTGSLEGFAGLYYTQGRNNDKNEPVIALDGEGNVPNLGDAALGDYLYAYFRPDGVK